MFSRKYVYFKTIFLIFFLAALLSQTFAQYQPKVQLGIDRLFMNPPKEIVGKNLFDTIFES